MGIGRGVYDELFDAVNGLEILDGTSDRLADGFPLYVGLLGRKLFAQGGQGSNVRWRGVEEGASSAELRSGLACGGGGPERVDVDTWHIDLDGSLGVRIVGENVS